MQTITLAGGCFWGLEELLRTQPGVIDTIVGYTGGINSNATYENHPGHAEAVQVTYDPSVTSAAQLLAYFFRIHDPTTLNQQGNDVGSSYRSAIFYDSTSQKTAAEAAIVQNQDHWSAPIVTSIAPLQAFWIAEEYHQRYLQKNPGGYTCHYERT